MKNNQYIAYEFQSSESGITKTRMFEYEPLTIQLKTCDVSVPFAIYTTEYGNYVCVRGQTYEYDTQFKGYKLYNKTLDMINL